MVTTTKATRYYRVLRSAAGAWRGDALAEGAILEADGSAVEALDQLGNASIVEPLPDVAEAGSLVELRAAVATWLRAVAGPIVQRVDGAAFVPTTPEPRRPVETYLTRERVLAKLQWSEADLTAAMSGHGFPKHAKCEARINERTGVWTRTGHQWIESEIDAWLTERSVSRRLFGPSLAGR